MQLFAAEGGGPLEEVSSVGVYVGGAESNVASGLAHLGQSAEWFSRVGNDPFGRRIVGFLRSRGVDVRGVIVDDLRPTGVYFKDRVDDRSEVYYYRAGSAASALSRADVFGLSLGARRLCHLSGVTAALSASCDDLLQRVLIERDRGQCPVSFDVNYRARLWDASRAAPRLLELARAADIVIVGRDEADLLWSTGDAEGVRRLFPDVPQLIVKDAEIGATQFSAAGSLFVPALRVDVVEPVGAGDAFAAGYLSGWLDGLGVERSLRLGHLMAAFTLRDVSDLPSLPPAAELAEQSALGGDSWHDLELGAGGLVMKKRRRS